MLSALSLSLLLLPTVAHYLSIHTHGCTTAMTVCNFVYSLVASNCFDSESILFKHCLSFLIVFLFLVYKRRVYLHLYIFCVIYLCDLISHIVFFENIPCTLLCMKESICSICQKCVLCESSLLDSLLLDSKT